MEISLAFFSINRDAEEVLYQVESFFCSKEVTSELGVFFASEEASGISFVSLEEEQPQRNFTCFTNYGTIIEGLLEAFLEREGIR